MGFGVTGGVIGSGPATRPGLGPRPEDVETTRLRSILFRPTNFFGDRLRSSSDSDSVRFPIFCTNTKTASISHFLHQKQLPFSQFLHKKQLSFSHLCTKKTPIFPSYAPKHPHFMHPKTPIFCMQPKQLPFSHFLHKEISHFSILCTKKQLDFMHQNPIPFSHIMHQK